MAFEKSIEQKEKDPIEAVRSFLCSYQVCLDMLNLRRHERKRERVFDDPFECEDVLAGGEVFWRGRMYEVRALIESMRNGREKIVLYYHYIRSMSIEHAADMLGVSRRTGYRLHQKGLFMASFLYQKKQKRNAIFNLPDSFGE